MRYKLVKKFENSNSFLHCSEALRDERIQKLIFRTGSKGYGLYWSLMEKMHQNDYALTPEAIEGFFTEESLYDWARTKESRRHFIDFLVSIELFYWKDGKLCSHDWEEGGNE